LTGQPALAFHSILEHDVIERNVFDSYYEAKEMLKRYFSHYNRRAAPHHRLHRSIGFITPQQKWEEAHVIYATTAAAAAFSENLSS
jgi:putative transposase